MWVNYKSDGGSLLVFYHDIGEFRYTSYKDAVILEIPGCQHKSLHSLVNRSGANCLHLRVLMFADDACINIFTRYFIRLNESGTWAIFKVSMNSIESPGYVLS